MIRHLLSDPRVKIYFHQLGDDYILGIPTDGHVENDMPPLPNQYIGCRFGESSVLAHKFNGAYGDPRHDDSHCPTDSWLEVVASCRENESMVLVNIGVNKGFNFANWINVFAKSTEVSPDVWQQTLMKLYPNSKRSDLCGNCGDCEVKFSPLNASDVRSST